MKITVIPAGEAIAALQSDKFLSDTPGARVSAFMPMQTAGRETQQNPIQFKNVLRSVSDKLERAGYPDHSALEAALSPLLDDRQFWQHQERGLAIFADAEEAQIIKVPLDLGERVYVTEHFQLLPLLPLLSSDEEHRVLAISQQRVRYLRVDVQGAAELPLPSDMPANLQAVVGSELTEGQLQFHASRGGADAAPVYHGQGVGKDDEKPELARFCRAIAEAVPTGADGQPIPLIVAGDTRLIAMLDNRTELDIHFKLEGNYDETDVDDLREKLSPYLQEQTQAMVAGLTQRFAAELAQERASLVPDQIHRAASEGRVDTLLVSTEREGSTEPLPPPDDAFCNDALLATLRNGGNAVDVPFVNMPQGRRLAAILRY